MKTIFSALTFVLLALVSTAASAQSYRITVDTKDAICLSGNRGGAPVYDLSVAGDSVTVKSGVTSFSAKVNPDGTFKTSYKAARGNSENVAEGNITPGHRTLKILITQMGCTYEGKE